MAIRLLRGDCRETLATLEPCSVQAAVTSPPYWGLRSYGTPDLVWGEWIYNHPHEWTSVVKPAANGIVNSAMQGETLTGNSGTRKPSSSGLCLCGAWLGSLGLEPTPELYVEHLVEVFRSVRRVVADDGMVWLNLGDSYAGSGKGPTGKNGIGGPGTQERRQGFDKSDSNRGSQKYALLNGGQPPVGLKAKDLMMIPARVAMALQADGWYLRSMIPWLKRNCLPEQYDRPSTSVEYVFLLSKSRKPYWDTAAVRMGSAPSSVARTQYNGGTPNPKSVSGAASGVYGAPVSTAKAYGQGRNRRNGDWFFESWQGLLVADDGDPLALVVNPTPNKLQHYASFPPKLVEPMIKASSRPGDTILDPFAGSGTTLLVADRLGRNAIGCELSESYSDMGTERVVGDAPLFVEMTS